MKKRLVWSTFILFALLIVSDGIWVLNGQTAAIPSSLALTVRPELTTINNRTSAAFAVRFPISAAVPLNINLIRVDSANVSTIVAALKDDGTGGDAVAGDRVWTAQITVTDHTAKTLYFQASAAFRGQLKRVLSNVVQFAILTPTTQAVKLPPDPGEAGQATLVGIDSDRDGVRDDTQRYILFTHPGAEQTRVYLTRYAIGLQASLTANPAETASAIQLLVHARRCVVSLLGEEAANDELATLKGVVLNTPTRTAAWIRASASFSGETIDGQSRANCL